MAYYEENKYFFEPHLISPLEFSLFLIECLAGLSSEMHGPRFPQSALISSKNGPKVAYIDHFWQILSILTKKSVKNAVFLALKGKIFSS